MKLSQRNGVWRIDEYLPDGSRIRKSLGTTDREEAKRKAAEVYAEAVSSRLKNSQGDSIAEGIDGRKFTISLGAAFARAMKEREDWAMSTAPKTLHSNYNALIKVIAPSEDLLNITYDTMLALKDHWRSAGLSASTINQRLSLVSVLLTMAADNWGFSKWITPYRMPRAKRVPGRIRVVSYEEEDELLRLFSTTKVRYARTGRDMVDLVPCLIDTGCRLGEMLKVNVRRDVDFENNRIQLWKTKSGKPRVIPMTPRVAEIMKKRAELPSLWNDMDGFAAAHAWSEIRASMGLGDDVEFVIHALRHTCASRLASKGMDAFRIMQYLGHTSVMTTQIYVTLFGNQLKPLAAALSHRDEDMTILETEPQIEAE